MSRARTKRVIHRSALNLFFFLPHYNDWARWRWLGDRTTGETRLRRREHSDKAQTKKTVHDDWASHRERLSDRASTSSYEDQGKRQEHSEKAQTKTIRWRRPQTIWRVLATEANPNREYEARREGLNDWWTLVMRIRIMIYDLVIWSLDPWRR